MEPEPKANILLVDDHPENLLVLEALLGKLEQNLVKAHSGEEALRRLLHQDFAVILLDVQMPGMDGFETASLIRQRERSRNTPIIFVTAFSTNDAFVFKGYSLGAVDYLLKPIDPVILTSKVSVFVDLFRKTEETKRQAAQLSAINYELRKSEERFRRLSNCSPVGIFLADFDRGCFYTNPRCQAICGFTAEESLGDGWIEFIHPEDRDRLTTNWFNYVRANEKGEFSDECRFQRKDGTICWTSMRASPLFSDQGELIGHVGTIEDITARKEAEAMREQVIREQAARQQAEAVNRMKDEFLAIVSHELRTPLNSILGWAKLLSSQKIDQSTATRALETIERNARSQAKLIEDILDVSRIIQGKLRLAVQSVNLNDLVTSVLETTRPTADAKMIQLKANLDQSLPMILADPERLQQVISNILSNAIKFTPSEGIVEVKLERIERADGDESMQHGDGKKPSIPSLSSLLSLPHSSYARITVTDTGIGISPDFLPHVFDHFRQADSTTTRFHGGLGLGLAIAHHIVDLHGGTITAESEGEGKGAKFTVTLPLLRMPASVEAVPR
jgi:PAS domain S-box-containing protein